MAMVEKYEGKTDAHDKANGDAGQQAVDRQRKRFSLRWDFWNNHAVAYWGSLIAGLLLTPLLDWSNMKPRQVYVVGIGVWIIVGMIIWFFCHSIVHHLTDTSEEDAANRDRQEIAHRAAVETKLAQLESRLVDTERHLLPRELTAEQRRHIVAAIEPFNGQMAIVCPIQDGEAKQYAHDIAHALDLAGWKTQIASGMAFSNFPLNFNNIAIVVDCRVAETDVPPPGFRSLYKAFGELGLARFDGQCLMDNLSDSLALDPDAAIKTIVIRVGPRPRRDGDRTA